MVLTACSYRRLDAAKLSKVAKHREWAFVTLSRNFTHRNTVVPTLPYKCFVFSCHIRPFCHEFDSILHIRRMGWCCVDSLNPSFRNTTQSNHCHLVAPNALERKFTVEKPNTAWVGDITYVWTLEGWLYLAVILDLYLRRVVGWTMGKCIDQALTLRALKMALDTREPGAGLVVHHTDRGSQYAANDYRKLLNARGIACSMSRRGNCWDNAVAESFFATLKVEFAHKTLSRTRAQATREIFEYIEVFYNRVRRHSSSSYLSPLDFETNYVPLHNAA
jgi:putative transposase